MKTLLVITQNNGQHKNLETSNGERLIKYYEKRLPLESRSFFEKELTSQKKKIYFRPEAFSRQLKAHKLVSL